MHPISWKKDEKQVYQKLSPDDEKFLMEKLALDYGLTMLDGGWKLICDDYEVVLDNLGYAVDESNWMLYYWDSSKYE